MVYLIHFETKYRNKCQHYLGWVETKGRLNRRMQKHMCGTGAVLLRYVTAAGISWTLVRVWKDGDKNFERKLKNHKKARIHCPICNPKKKKFLCNRTARTTGK